MPRSGGSTPPCTGSPSIPGARTSSPKPTRSPCASTRRRTRRGAGAASSARSASPARCCSRRSASTPSTRRHLALAAYRASGSPTPDTDAAGPSALGDPARHGHSCRRAVQHDLGPRLPPGDLRARRRARPRRRRRLLVARSRGQAAPDVFRPRRATPSVSRPSACVYVGDRLFEDVHGPQQVGMRAILVPHSTSRSASACPSTPTPDAVAHELLDVLDIVALERRGTDDPERRTAPGA